MFFYLSESFNSFLYPVTESGLCLLCVCTCVCLCVSGGGLADALTGGRILKAIIMLVFSHKCINKI